MARHGKAPLKNCDPLPMRLACYQVLQAAERFPFSQRLHRAVWDQVTHKPTLVSPTLVDMLLALSNKASIADRERLHLRAG